MTQEQELASLNDLSPCAKKNPELYTGSICGKCGKVATNCPDFTMSDFRKGLMLAGYVQPANEQEVKQKAILDNYQQPAPAKEGISVQHEDDSDRELEITTDRNMDLISEFVEHLKDEAGIDIPESAILSFFNA
jgi:hypothetical protein